MAPGIGRFRHEASICAGIDAFVAVTARFVREGREADEPALIAVATPQASALREEFAGDGAGVEFLDMEAIGRNPARIIPAWHEWVERNRSRGNGFRGVGEPVWAGRNSLEIRECQMHEHLLNTAFTDGPAWSLLCPYDAERLPTEVIEHVSASHPVVTGAAARDGEGRPAFDALAGRRAFATPLPELGAPLVQLDFGVRELARVRSAIRDRATHLGLAGRRLGDFLLVADELAANSIRHGGGGGLLRVWRLGEYAVVEADDRGLITDPLAGRRRPDIRKQDGGAGLWSANQLCDLLLIHSAPGDGTAVRAYLPVAA